MIKPMEKNEINQVMDIWLKTNISAHNFIPKKHWIERYNIVKKEYLPFSTTFIYKEDNKIKGFISIRDNSFIGGFFVLENYQGTGIGRKLINYCKSLYPSLKLGVYIENTKAVNFYKSCGFVIEKEQPNKDSGFMQYQMSWIKKE